MNKTYTTIYILSSFLSCTLPQPTVMPTRTTTLFEQCYFGRELRNHESLTKKNKKWMFELPHMLPTDASIFNMLYHASTRNYTGTLQMLWGVCLWCIFLTPKLAKKQRIHTSANWPRVQDKSEADSMRERKIIPWNHDMILLWMTQKMIWRSSCHTSFGSTPSKVKWWGSRVKLLLNEKILEVSRSP